MTKLHPLANSQATRHPWPQVDGIPSTLIDKMGRIKTDRQILLDANRVNPESNLGHSTRETNSFKAPR